VYLFQTVQEINPPAISIAPAEPKASQGEPIAMNVVRAMIIAAIHAAVDSRAPFTLFALIDLDRPRGLIGQRQQALHNSTQTDKHHKQLEQACQSAVANKRSISTKQIAPTTTTIKTPIRTEIAITSLAPSFAIRSLIN
jgi:hypothetical protein